MNDKKPYFFSKFFENDTIHYIKDKTKVLPEYLTLALNSEVENVVVPVIDYETQRQIAELIEKSFFLRGESERLLEEAKEIVEKEIEAEIVSSKFTLDT